jgi:hypothetical protein
LRLDTLISIILGPAAKPILGPGGRLARQFDLMAVIAAYPRLSHCKIAAAEADLALGHASTVADAASSAAVAWTGQKLRVLAQNLFRGFDPSD